MTGSLPPHQLTRLISAQRLSHRIHQLGSELSRHFAGKDPLILVAMDGASYFAADLSRALKLDAVRIHYLKASSYHGGTKSSGSVGIKGLPSCAGEDILLLDDILDTGHTLHRLQESLLKAGAKSIHNCILLDKPGGRQISIAADRIGFTVPNKFLVGYGLDYAGRLRNLPDIYTLEHAN